MKSDLQPGPTWDEALRLIRRHDTKTAWRLEWEHFVALRGSVPRRALAELESEALDLFEKLSQDGDRSAVTALESREVETCEPDPV